MPCAARVRADVDGDAIGGRGVAEKGEGLAPRFLADLESDVRAARERHKVAHQCREGPRLNETGSVAATTTVRRRHCRPHECGRPDGKSTLGSADPVAKPKKITRSVGSRLSDRSDRLVPPGGPVKRRG